MSREERERERWDYKYEVLVRFVRQYGRLPTQTESLDGVRIGQWVDVQRRFEASGRLSFGRVERMNQVPHMRWRKHRPESELFAPKWPQAYNLVVEFVQQSGRLPVAVERIDTPDGVFAIGAWCARQKQAYARGGMRLERFALLNDIRCWEWAQPRLWWNEMYEVTLAWCKERGSLPGPDEVVEMTLSQPGFDDWDDSVGPTMLRIGAWWRAQRLCRGRNRLNTQQRQLMERLPGFPGWPAGAT